MAMKRSDGGLFLPGHDGRPKGMPDHTAMHGPASASDAFSGHQVPGNIARDGAPKAHHDVPVHGGMTERQRELKGMGHAIGSAPDASAADPRAPTVPGKTFTAAAPVVGHRSRILNDDLHGGTPGANHARATGRNGNLDHALGAAIMDDALEHADAATHARYGRE